mmetsp:Transcript_5990/g.6695  ORF Transcript_5990/g.6695 Transcript_5990/m.6695 type:complete len:203 (+) Transcript_5990:22-630(+)
MMMILFKLSFSCLLLVLQQIYILSPVKGWIPATTTSNLQRRINAVFKYSVDDTTATTSSSSFNSFLMATKNNKNNDYGADTDADADADADADTAFDSLPSSDSRRDFMTKSSIFAMTTTAASIVSASATTALILTPKPALAATATEDNNNKNNKIYNVPSDSLNGKTIVITGGTAGLGLESAKRLAAGGATIILTSRTAKKR